MRIQPLIVFKTKQGAPQCTMHFRSITKASKWLRAEGCKFSNSLFYTLGEESVTLTTQDYEYEVESDPLRSSQRRRKDEPSEI